MDATARIRQIRRRELSARELVQVSLQRIRSLDPQLGAFLSVDPEGALAAADEVDRRLDRGEEVGPLAGMPLAVKDNLATPGLPTTCASRMLQGWCAPYEATAVARLRAAGAVLLGKTNMDEFAMGSSTEWSALGVTRNPWDPTRVPGGSSGGSAAAVAAGLCAAALGSDTGGSVRQPAAYCGVVGLRPSYGRVSRHGLVAFASSMDQVGPVTRSVRDAALLLSVMAGRDPRDSTSLDLSPPAAPEEGRGLARGLRLGLLADSAEAAPSAEMSAALTRAAGTLEQLGCRVEPVQLPGMDMALSSYYLLGAAEASSNLSRYDGARYGSPAGAGPFLDGVREVRGGGFGPEVKRRILLGAHALSAGAGRDLHGRAMAARALLTAELRDMFERFDLLLSPTAPDIAFVAGAHRDAPLGMYLNDTYTVAASLAGLPAISLPCGQGAQGLPLGMQLTAPRLADEALLALAAAYEQAAPFPTLPDLAGQQEVRP